MLTGIHILLSYACLFQCDHCFLHCSPTSGGTFTHARLDSLLSQAAETGTVRSAAFEGGEPFLFYPLMLAGVARAKSLGFSTEIVSNGYWALDTEDARRWLEPLRDAGLDVLSVSMDEYHGGEDSPAKYALQAAERLGIKNRAFTIDPPVVQPAPDVFGDGGVSGEAETSEYGVPVGREQSRGDPIVGGDVRFRGRAADSLTGDLPRRDWRVFRECPDEDFSDPRRVHVDGCGQVQVCQGISIGNVWERPLREIMETYDPDTHPVCGPLLRGGPAALAVAYGVDADADFEGRYVDACHLCYRTRLLMRRKGASGLEPGQAYGG